MTKINNLVYFLNSIKDILPFENEKDFREKIKKSKEFRIKVQKLVYLSKYFGWNNSYYFNFHIHGPFSTTLSADYNNYDLINQECEKIDTLNLEKFKLFIENSNIDALETKSTPSIIQIRWI